MLLTILVVCLLGLALLDSTNAPLYTIVYWPACCIAFAGALVAWGRWLGNRLPARGQGRAGAVALISSALIIIGAPLISDSVSVYRDIRERRDAVTDYTTVAEQIDAAIPAGAAVVGHERWWWGLHERDYRALNVLYFEWERQEQQPDRAASFSDLVDATGATAIVIDDNARSEIGRYPDPLQHQIAAFLVNETAPAIVITDPSYGRFEIYLRRPPGP
jgi:hypothetical protein